MTDVQNCTDTGGDARYAKARHAGGAPMTCYPDAWDSIWRAFDGTRADRIKVMRSDLATLIDCTERPMPQGLVIMTGDKWVTCHRATLFDLLNRHGREPCKKESP